MDNYGNSISASGFLDVVFISTYNTSCGIATYTEDLAEALVELGHKVTVLAQKEPKLEKPYSLRGVKVYPVWKKNHPANWKILSRVIRDANIKPDVIHVQHEFGLFPDLKGFSKFCNENHCFVTWHTPHEHCLGVPSIVHHPKAALTYDAKYIPHGCKNVGTYDKKLARNKLKLSEDATIFFCPGFMNPRKGQIKIAKAFMKTFLHVTGDRLYIVGQCNDPGYLNDLTWVGNTSLAKIHVVPAFQPPERMDLWFQASDVVILGGPKKTPLSASGQLAHAIAYRKSIFVRDTEIYKDHQGAAIEYNSYKELEDLLPCSDSFTFENKRASEIAKERLWTNIAKQHAVYYNENRL